MLIELWERLRGYDQWPTTAATITQARVKRTAHTGRDGSVTYSYSSADELQWIDLHGQKRSARFTVPDDSPLYQLIGDETIQIQYDPENPSRV